MFIYSEILSLCSEILSLCSLILAALLRDTRCFLT